MSTPFPLGRVTEHDPRSLDYPVRALVDTLLVSRRWRKYGQILDQGDLGSCTGNAGIAALNHVPFHVTGTKCGTELDAIDLYSAATVVDAYSGSYPPDDTGSSGLAVAKVLKSQGRINGYTHAFGFDHFLAALMLGPVMVGTSWYDDMFYPTLSGYVMPTGPYAGGHEYLATGVDTYNKVIRFQNSWGYYWGVGGKFYMSYSDFTSLLADEGDAILLADS